MILANISPARADGITTLKRQIVLTVAESKRLIAKGVAALPEVQQAMTERTVVVIKTTTNAYVLEELWGKKIDKRAYRLGVTTPKEPEKAPKPLPENIPDKIFIKGKVADEYDRITIVPHLKKGDIYIKSANVLNYKDQVAGILIGALDGGTFGSAVGHILGKQVNLIIPIGLEKLTYENINELHLLASEEDYEGPQLWPIVGTIITEIEALGLLTGVTAYLYASGGIAGAEGAVRLMVEGTEEEVNETLDLIESIKGEPRYLL